MISRHLHEGMLRERTLPSPPNPHTHPAKLAVLTCKDLVHCTLHVWGCGEGLIEWKCSEVPFRAHFLLFLTPQAPVVFSLFKAPM